MSCRFRINGPLTSRPRASSIGCDPGAVNAECRAVGGGHDGRCGMCEGHLARSRPGRVRCGVRRKGLGRACGLPRGLAAARPRMCGDLFIRRARHVFQETGRHLRARLHRLRQPAEDADRILPYQVGSTNRRASASHPRLRQCGGRQRGAGPHDAASGRVAQTLLQRARHVGNPVRAVLAVTLVAKGSLEGDDD
jgi:hypothetical protein